MEHRKEREGPLGYLAITDVTDTDFGVVVRVREHYVNDGTERNVLLTPRLPIALLEEVRAQISRNKAA